MRRLWIWVALVAAGVIPFIYGVAVAPRALYTDFDVYYRAAQRWQAGQFPEIYSLADGASPFRYFPTLLSVFAPFADFELVSAKRGWFVVQYLAFTLGFGLLAEIATLIRRDRDGEWATAAAFLMTLRMVWDTFMIGQVSSLMFAGFSIGLWAWVLHRPRLATFGVFVPAVLKIGPAFLFGLFALSRRRFSGPSFRTGLVLSAVLVLLTWTVFAPWPRAWELVGNWFEIVSQDSTYFDASHYANQSMKGVLLRTFPEQAAWMFPLFAFALCSSVLLFWLWRFPRGFEGRAHFFSLGLFVYLACMPETFKYSMTTLAFPLALVLSARQKTKLDWLAIAVFFFTISAPAKDILPQSLFFGIQRASLPALAIAILGLTCARRAARLSRPSHFARWVSLAFRQPPAGPWLKEPESQSDSIQISWILPLPLDSQSTFERDRLPALLKRWKAAMSGVDCEWIIVPYGDRSSKWVPIEGALSPLGDVGRGQALRAGFLHARGRSIGTLSLEQPVGEEFLQEAWKILSSSQADLVRANRRDPQSRFQIPVSVLHQVYGRHRMGLRFNRLVRLMLPHVRASDTQSGSFLLSRKLASHAFACQYSSGFLFDLELSLAAAGMEARETELAVQLQLPAEKASRRVFAEAFAILRGLPILASRWRRGCYLPLTKPAQAISADDWGLSPGVNRGILALAKRGVIKRVSLMADGPHLSEGLQELIALPGIELGLHFNLTYASPDPTRLRGRSPGRLLLAWVFGRSQLLPRAVDELRTQLSSLERSGTKITYLDGHHHIHLLPGLIDAIAPELKARGIKQVRLPYDPALWLTSRLPLVLLALLAKQALDRNGFVYSSFFYPKLSHFLDPASLRGKLARNPEIEMIVHPSDSDDVRHLSTPDSYSSERVIEFLSLRMLARE
jgi:predicted glycoside hydrolase/deacetylase ChbG (UPF0249 family)